MKKKKLSIFYLWLDGEILCTSLEEASERRAKRGKKEETDMKVTALGQLL